MQFFVPMAIEAAATAHLKFKRSVPGSAPGRVSFCGYTGRPSCDEAFNVKSAGTFPRRRRAGGKASSDGRKYYSQMLQRHSEASRPPAPSPDNAGLGIRKEEAITPNSLSGTEGGGESERERERDA